MRKVLIIEDDHILNESISDFLKIEGYTTFNAYNGLKGIQMAIEHTPNIILCDVEMPKLDGLEVYNIIKSHEQLFHIPFIFISVRSSKEEIRLGMQLGVDDYIGKPFDFYELLKTINIRLKKSELLQKQNIGNTLALIENSENSIFLLKDKSILLYNKNFLKFLGYKSFDIRNIDFFNLIEYNKIDEVKETISKCLKGLFNKFRCSFDIKTNKNTYITVELIGSSIYFNESKIICAELRPVNMVSKEYHNDHFENLDRLSKREIEILNQICKGLTNNEISKDLNISHLTVDKHRGNILSKTNCKNTAQLIVYAFRTRFLKP